MTRHALVASVLLSSGCYVGLDAGKASGGDGADDAADSGGSDGGVPASCEGGIHPGSAPLRRLTRFEYNNTVRDLLGDDTLPANAFPSEESGNGFGNDAAAQSVSSLLAEQYATVAEGVATRVIESPDRLAALAPCTTAIGEGSDAASESTCVRDLVASLLPRAWRRPVAADEIDELVALYQGVRGDATFPVGVAAVVEAVLQSPDFLYRVERGELDDDGNLRPTGHEMATRLSYLFWGTMPDEALFAAAEQGELSNPEGVLAHAERLLDDERSRPMVRFFFDNLLPLQGLSQLERDPVRYPAYTPGLGASMREEAHQLLAYEIFEGPGTWTDALTAPYTFVDATLAAFYGIEGVTGDAFQKVELDGKQRLGLLTQAGMVAGTIHSNETNPVVRGSFIVQKLMCKAIPLPTGDVLDQVKPPDPYSGDTARDRFGKHSQDPVCAGCHRFMDPVGLALENYDAIGQWRDRENDVVIDARGELPGIEGTFDGPIELARAIAGAEATQTCFAHQWASFAYGRTLDDDDACTESHLADAFVASGSDIRQLLLDLTQTDAFLYLPRASEEDP